MAIEVLGCLLVREAIGDRKEGVQLESPAYSRKGILRVDSEGQTKSETQTRQARTNKVIIKHNTHCYHPEVGKACAHWQHGQIAFHGFLCNDYIAWLYLRSSLKSFTYSSIEQVNCVNTSFLNRGVRK